MGKEIEAIALERGHSVPVKIDSNNSIQELQNQVDVAIEFTQPDQAFNNIAKCLQMAVPVVVGTTGWYNKFNEMVKECEAQNGSVLYATNFSVGVNIVFKINEILANLMQKTEGYQAHIEEIHHIHKKDSPSGTAISLAQGLIANNADYSNWAEKPLSERTSGELPIVAFREDEVPGLHEIIYDYAIDTISLKHAAKSRKGFALGSVLAAEFLHGKKGVYNMNDLLKLNK